MRSPSYTTCWQEIPIVKTSTKSSLVTCSNVTSQKYIVEVLCNYLPVLLQVPSSWQIREPILVPGL